MWEQWGVGILVFPLTWHIAYTTACCYRSSRDHLGLEWYREVPPGQTDGRKTDKQNYCS